MGYLINKGTLCIFKENFEDFIPCKCQYDRNKYCDKECAKFEIKENTVILHCPEKRIIEIFNEVKT